MTRFRSSPQGSRSVISLQHACHVSSVGQVFCFVSFLLIPSPSHLLLSLVSCPPLITQTFHSHCVYCLLPNPHHHHHHHSPHSLQEESHPVLTPEQIQLLIQVSQNQQQQGQGQVASAAPQEEDDQQPPAQPTQALLTSPNKASLETLHQLLQLQYLQQQLSAATAQPHSTEPTVCC